MMTQARRTPGTAHPSGVEEAPQDVASLLERVRGGETALFEAVIRRHNQRLYRLARTILRDDVEAEEVLQNAYVRAYENLTQLRDLERFPSWIAHIVVHEAWARMRRRRHQARLACVPDGAAPEPTS